MVSFSNDLWLPALTRATFDRKGIFDRVVLGRSVNGTCSSGHEPKIANAPDLHEDKDKDFSNQVAPVFQPSAESLAVFDEAKKECEQGGRRQKRLYGWSGLRCSTEEARGQSENHAPSLQSSAESLSIFDKANKECDEGRSFSKRSGLLGANDAHPIRPILENSGSKVTNSVTTDAVASLLGDRSPIDVSVEHGLKPEAKDKDKTVDHSGEDGSFDAVTWCTKVREHQSQAFYLKPNNRRAHLETKKRSRQPFTPWDRYRNPPRRSVASACWESWCLDEKTAESRRRELRKRASQEKHEANVPGQFVISLASTCRHLSRGMFSWLSLTTNKLWRGVCSIPKRIIGLEV